MFNKHSFGWRRWAIVALAAAPLVLSVTRGARAADEPSHRINVGLQLYSLRAPLAKDVPGSLDVVEKWGITDVETAGFYSLSPEKFREELDKHHLKASGAHYQWDRLSKDVDGIIKEAKTLGVEYVTCPWVPHGKDYTLDDANRTIEKFNEWGKKFADAGLHFTYHAHGYEWVKNPEGEGTLFDLIASKTDPKNVNFELDIFWAYHGGADPVKLMEKYPDRFPQMHLKDMRKSVKVPKHTGSENTENDVALGTGQIDIASILKEAEKIGVKHYYIEDESKESEQQVPESLKYVRSLGY
jgi:sugar phosphate isomerase/epimerase